MFIGEHFYLLSLQIAGIKNIESPVEFEFYKKTITKNFDPQQYRIKAIYGENGSGKTAVITAVRIMRNLLLDKNYLLTKETQKTLFETVNKKRKSGFIECVFMASDTDSETAKEKRNIFRYRISFVLKDDQRVYIDGEKLEKKNGNSSSNLYVTVFETNHGQLVDVGDSKLYEALRERTLNLLDRSSLLTLSHEIIGFITKEHIDIQQQIMPLFLFAVSLDTHIDYEDNHTDYVLRGYLAEIAHNGITDPEMQVLQDRIKDKIIYERDDDCVIFKDSLGSVETEAKRKCEFVKIFKPELRDIRIETIDLGEYYRYRTIMVYDDYTIDSEFESRGIKKLLSLFDSLDDACRGGIAFVDELDANISDVYLSKLIEYFSVYGKGQLCFTAHNLSPMSLLVDLGCKKSIDFLSSINTVHSWAQNGNLNPENAYRNGFVEDSPFNVDTTDFIGILGETYE